MTIDWRGVATLMRRPQPVTLPMIALFAIIPIYLYIGSLMPGRTLHAPELALDRMVTASPAWSLVYLSLFCAALLPVFVLHQQDLIRRTVLAYLTAWLVSYACFLAYPTLSPRPGAITGDGFLAWTLREIYSSDVRYNCFPSLHVAQCFIAALAASRVHRTVGAFALAWAALVGASTVFTKQHYVADVLGGMLLAAICDALFLRDFPREAVPAEERRLAPSLAACAFGAYGILMVILWLAYLAADGQVV